MRTIVSAVLPEPTRTVVLADNHTPPRISAEGFSADEVLAWLTTGEKSLATWGITPSVNVWLGSLPHPVRLDLYASIRVQWKDWRLLYVPGKFLEIWRGRQTWRVFDVSGFWPAQETLHGMCTQWSVDALPDAATYDAAARKEWTSTPGRGLPLTTIAATCTARALTLDRLMSRVLPALEAADMRPSRLTGSGAIASRFLREADAQHWLARYRPDRQPLCGTTELLPIMLSAYYGGRQETTVCGTWVGIPTYRYDIRSAYPWALSHLGAAGYLWEQCDTWRPSADDRMSLWYVSWDMGAGALGPLPWRHRSGSIAYPLKGSGWYWWPEVRAALAAYGPSIRILTGYRALKSRRRPLAPMIAARYQQRRDLEAVGDPTAVILKQALAAVAGRMAQKLGAEGDPGRWYNIGLAGWVTSAVRGKLISAWSGNEGCVGTISTDGMLSIKRLDVPTDDALGGWKVDTWDSASVILPGIYRTTRSLPNGDRETMQAMTGVSGVDFDWLLREVSYGGMARVRTRVFVPNILPDTFPDAWEEKRCRWITGTTTINPYRVARKRDGAEGTRGLSFPDDWITTTPYERVGPGDSHAHEGPPAWQPGGTDRIHEAVKSATKG